ncbi:MAG TPA: hypothetical protein HA326_05495 [Thermoplasmata archaeon]|nr:hypothetical protein [Thermoplasmata archaeon]
MAAMGLLMGSYHRIWYPDSGHPGTPNAEEAAEIRETMRDRDEAMLEKLRSKLKEVESESPWTLVRSEHHIEREKTKLLERIRRLEHEVSILSAA